MSRGSGMGDPYPPDRSDPWSINDRSPQTRKSPDTPGGFNLVTAPREVHVVTRQGNAWNPYGEWHARKVGSPCTACGLGAVNWHYFWTLRFDDAESRACPRCALASSGRRRRDPDAVPSDQPRVRGGSTPRPRHSMSDGASGRSAASWPTSPRTASPAAARRTRG